MLARFCYTQLMIYRFIYRHGYNYRQFAMARVLFLWAFAIPFIFAVAAIDGVVFSFAPSAYAIAVFYALFKASRY